MKKPRKKPRKRRRDTEPAEMAYCWVCDEYSQAADKHCMHCGAPLSDYPQPYENSLRFLPLRREITG